ncbi:MAG TPA: DUF305 domain-containing protein [Gemmatimonadales bacterium]|nr:DUF305 domain-containing protein [Gemmatimonadales bacterium]
MRRIFPSILAAGVAISSASATRTAAQTMPDTGRFRYTAADVAFMSGMIHHHAQAVLMAGWAASHGASPTVRTLCDRIVVAQRDEIALMQRWLRDRNLPAPEPDAEHDVMPGMEHIMPGMLNAEQLAQLDSARGPDFDRLFLTSMIRHHQGAITMVNQLQAAPGAGEEETVFRFSSDVYADQTTEIARMQRMLATLLFAGPSGQ